MNELRLQTHNLSNYERTTALHILGGSIVFSPKTKWERKNLPGVLIQKHIHFEQMWVASARVREKGQTKNVNLMPTRLRTRMRKIPSGRSGSTRNDTLYLQSADTGPKNRNAKLRRNTSLWSMESHWASEAFSPIPKRRKSINSFNNHWPHTHTSDQRRRCDKFIGNCCRTCAMCVSWWDLRIAAHNSQLTTASKTERSQARWRLIQFSIFFSLVSINGLWNSVVNVLLSWRPAMKTEHGNREEERQCVRSWLPLAIQSIWYSFVYVQDSS